MKKCGVGLSKYSFLALWILESLWLLYELSQLWQSKHICFFFSPPSSLEDILRDTTLVFSSALKRGTKLCWNYSNRWAVSMEIKPRLPDEAFYSMVPITENPCGWPWADTFTLRIQSQVAISQQRLWLSYISLKESQTYELLPEYVIWICEYELWWDHLCMHIHGLSLWPTFSVYDEIINMCLLILEEHFVSLKVVNHWTIYEKAWLLQAKEWHWEFSHSKIWYISLQRPIYMYDSVIIIVIINSLFIKKLILP